jgi:pimeloyl-[acyl-carrier protein] methyl ester esterase
MMTCQLADGRCMAYRDAGSGPALVLLHGWSLSSAVFIETLEALADDFRVLAPDLRGHGASDPGPGYGLEDFAGDLCQWLEKLGLAELDLLGWSLGGQVALHLGSLIPNRIRRMLLVSGTPCFVAKDGWPAGLPAGQVKSMARNLRRRYRDTLDDFFERLFVPGEVSDARMKEIRNFAAPREETDMPAKQAGLAALETLQACDLRGGLADLGLPTLVVHGERDGIIPCDAGKYLADRLPQGRYVGLQDTGHAPFLSRSEQCLELVREFCRP